MGGKEASRGQRQVLILLIVGPDLLERGATGSPHASFQDHKMLVCVFKRCRYIKSFKIGYKTCESLKRTHVTR